MQDSERPNESTETPSVASSVPNPNTVTAAKPAGFGLQWFFQVRWILVLLGLLVLFALWLNWNLSNKLEQAQKQQTQLLQEQKTLSQRNQTLELTLSQNGQRLAQLEAEYAAHVAAGPNEVLSYAALKQVDTAIAIVRQWQQYRKSHKSHLVSQQKPPENTALVASDAAKAAAAHGKEQEEKALGYGERVVQWLSLQWQSLQQASLERIGSWVRIRPLPSIELEHLDANAMALSEDGLLQFLLSARLALLARQNEDALVSLELVQQQADFLFAQLNDSSAKKTYLSLTKILQNALRTLRGA